MQEKFAVIGGDRRLAALAQTLTEDGFAVSTYAVEGFAGGNLEAALRGAAVAALPLPSFDAEGNLIAQSGARVRAADITALLTPGMRVFGGKLGAEAAVLAGSGAAVIDYLDLEQLTAANAVPTAEGAIQIAMERLPVTIQGCRALVIGWGRIGKILARKLRLLGADVTVSARREADAAMIAALGMQDEITGRFCRGLSQYDLVVNTVPARVLEREQLRQLRPRCVIVDLASEPGGVDLDAAAALGHDAVRALSLPGRVAPLSAGRLLRDAILSYLDLR